VGGVRRWIGGRPAAAPHISSLAVIPLDNLSGDPEQQYFAEGLAESVIVDLARFRALFVIARNASFAYRSADADLTEVGRKLGVRYVLTGSLWGSGDRLRLNLQLSDAESGGMLWTTRREFDKADLFRTQDEVTRDIVSALPGRIEAHWLEGSRRKRAENFVAYDFTLKAWDLLYEHGGDQHTAIRSLVQQAIFLQPGYAQAQAMLAYSWMLTWFRNQDPSALDAAEREAKRALLPDQPRQVPAAPRIGDQAERGEALDEFCRCGGDDEVAGERDVRAGARRDAVHTRNHRLRHGRKAADERVPARLDRGAKVDRLARRDGAVVEVLPGAKAAPGAGQDDDPRGGGGVERLRQFGMHRAGEAVEAVGAVEDDPRDAAVEAEDDRFELCHAAAPAVKIAAYSKTPRDPASIMPKY
jgi:TolB-like protein